MKVQYKTSTILYIDLACQLPEGETLPSVEEILQSALAKEPLVSKISVHVFPSWKQVQAPWQTLEESPLEPGDLIIHVCQMNKIQRTLLAECVLDTEQPGQLRIAYLSHAGEESVERRVWEYMRATYPSYKEGFYPCPKDLAEQSTMD